MKSYQYDLQAPVAEGQRSGQQTLTDWWLRGDELQPKAVIIRSYFHLILCIVREICENGRKNWKKKDIYKCLSWWSHKCQRVILLDYRGQSACNYMIKISNDKEHCSFFKHVSPVLSISGRQNRKLTTSHFNCTCTAGHTCYNTSLTTAIHKMQMFILQNAHMLMKVPQVWHLFGWVKHQNKEAYWNFSSLRSFFFLMWCS